MVTSILIPPLRLSTINRVTNPALPALHPTYGKLHVYGRPCAERDLQKSIVLCCESEPSSSPLLLSNPPKTAIPTVENGGNHTSAFADAARSMEGHRATLDVAKALALVGVRVVADDRFFARVLSCYPSMPREKALLTPPPFSLCRSKRLLRRMLA